jgi:hypothetical protein
MQYFTASTTTNTPFECMLSLATLINGELDALDVTQIKGQYTFKSNSLDPTQLHSKLQDPTQQSLIEAFDQLAISQSTVTPPTSTPQPHNISVLLSITPSHIQITKSTTTHTKLYIPLLTFLRTLCETFNAIWATLIDQLIETQETSGTTSHTLPTALPTIPTTFKKPKQTNQYCYTQSTGVFSQSFPFTTTLSATLISSQFYHEFIQSGFTETSWNQPCETNRIVSAPDDQHTRSNLPQFTSVPTTFAQLFTYRPTPITSSIEHTQYQNQITTLITALNLTNPTSPLSIPSALAYTSQLWYGSHGLSSPFRFETILSSDTIYSSPTMPIFLQSIRSLLSRSGKAYIAAKRYYFGVGGSTAEFVQHITQNCPDLNVKTVEVFMDGSSNIREILEISWNKDVIKGLW